MYIFLDVDGVLNRRNDWNRPFSLNSECVKCINLFVSGIPNAKIVLSSTWRNGIARDGTVAAHIDDLLKALAEAGIKTIDGTATAPDGSRSKEIDFYLRRHDPDSYVILDDDPNLFERGVNTDNLYVIDSKFGLTERDVKKLIKRYE